MEYKYENGHIIPINNSISNKRLDRLEEVVKTLSPEGGVLTKEDIAEVAVKAENALKTANTTSNELSTFKTNVNNTYATTIDRIRENTANISEIEEEVATKQQELTLTVLDNGNIRISNLQGQTKDFMPATPSGDPMHYAYEAMGAVWNTKDSISATPWASLVDDADYNAQWGLNLIPGNATFVKNVEYKGVDKEVYEMTHPCSGRTVWVVATYSSSGVKVWDETLFVIRQGRWTYFAVGDLTNDNIRDIYEQGVSDVAEYFPKAYINSVSKLKGITNRLFTGNLNIAQNISGTFYGNKNVEYHIFDIGLTQKWGVIKLSATFSSGPLKHLYTKGYLQPKGVSLSNTLLTTAPIAPDQNFTLKTNEISKKSIQYCIENSTKPTSGELIITLPAGAFNRLNEDADIKTLLENYNYIQLASS